MMALGAIRAARQHGLTVPGDVSVVGFDDSPLIAFTDPPLTTIRQPVTAMGQAAVRALLEEIGGTPAPHSEFVFLPELWSAVPPRRGPAASSRHCPYSRYPAYVHRMHGIPPGVDRRPRAHGRLSPHGGDEHEDRA